MSRPATLRATPLGESLPGHDRPPRLGTPSEHAHHDPRAERVTAKIVVSVAEAKMLDKRKPIVGEHVRWIRGRVVGLCALSVAAQVREHDAIPLPGERLDRAVLEPLRTPSPAHKADQNDQRSAGSCLTACKSDAVAANETIRAHIVSDRKARESMAEPVLGATCSGQSNVRRAASSLPCAKPARAAGTRAARSIMLVPMAAWES